jgi:threonine/homoserine/homoserine lactone efflux protein
VLLQIFLIHLAAIASPGPNVLLVAHTSLAGSRRAGLWAAAGVATGAFCWAALVAAGLGLLFRDSDATGTLIRVAGGLYLVFLGVRTFRSASRPLDAAPPATTRGHGPWAQGLLTNLTNPKAGVFYVSVFGTTLPATASPSLRAAAVVLIFVNALVWHAVIAFGLSTPRARGRYLRSRGWIDRVAGAVMATFGVLLISFPD